MCNWAGVTGYIITGRGLRPNRAGWLQHWAGLDWLLGRFPTNPRKRSYQVSPGHWTRSHKKFIRQVKTAIQHLIKPMTAATETSDTSNIKQTEISCGPPSSLIALSPSLSWTFPPWSLQFQTLPDLLDLPGSFLGMFVAMIFACPSFPLHISDLAHWPYTLRLQSARHKLLHDRKRLQRSRKQLQSAREKLQ